MFHLKGKSNVLSLNKKHLIFLVLLLSGGIILIATAQTMAAANFQYAFSPRQGATELIIKTIGEAKKSIKLASYSFTSKKIAAALIEAQNNGIDVKIVMDKSQDLEPYSLLPMLLDHKVPVRVNYKYDIMHNKFMVIDNKTLQLGSFNYTWAAETKNAENILVIKNESKLAQTYATQWQKLWDESD